MDYRIISRPTWSKRSQIELEKMKQDKVGIIPFVKIEETLWFCFGLDSKTRELVDFSGVPVKMDRSIEDTALRKCRDESLGIFNISRSTLEETDPIYIYDDRSAVILVPIALQFDKEIYCKFFSAISEPFRFSKFEEIRWIDQREIIEIISKKNPKMQKRLRCLIRDISKIVPLLSTFNSIPRSATSC